MGSRSDNGEAGGEGGKGQRGCPCSLDGGRGLGRKSGVLSVWGGCWGGAFLQQTEA